MKAFKYLSFTVMLVALVAGCKKSEPLSPPLVIKEDPAKAASRAKEVREATPVKLMEGLTLSLWATDSLAPDPVAMAMDDQGRVYINRTNRQKNSEFDIRGHRDWMIPSISLNTVEERRDFLKVTFAPEKSSENKWLKDLNKDSVHDWHDLAVEQDEIWRLEDTNNDGMADISTRILSDFNEEITDVAGGMLVRNEDIFVAIAPDLWRLKDNNGDGLIDEKQSIAHGYAVHIGFSGHGMSGVTEGPDGKIYWNIGDIGSNVTSPDGKNHNYSNEGTIARANPDGSDFEIFAHGLRNTHEFVFDEYGNIISEDNDGDHQGESERLVYIVEGSDAGWRSNWQYGKYVDPKNNGYKVWMDEKLAIPRWEGQAAYIIPPIINYHNGPTGVLYNPGTALGKQWKNNFFVTEFVGNPSRSNLWAFTLKPKGASFELAEEKNVLNGVLATSIRFGPDGAMYLADWINGWGTKNLGRVWKLDVSEDKNDLAKERIETKRLIQLNYGDQTDDELSKLLYYGDMRVRQKAQFELATRGKDGAGIFKQAMEQNENQLARVHGIWGTGQLAWKDKSYGAPLIDLLTDSDPEIIAQAAKILGDVKYADAVSKLVLLLANENYRIRFFAAQALGRLEYKEAVAPLLAMIEKNNDEDVYIRHAAVLALARIGQVEPIATLSKNPNRSLRIAAVLVLRKLSSDQVALFLQDQDEYVVTEAARAINDDLSIPAALPALAAVLNEKRFTSEPLLRRAINASLRVGTEKELDLLIAFAKRSDVAGPIRAEALATIASWPEPSVLDRVDGRFRGKVTHDAEVVKTKVKSNIDAFLASADASVLIATSQLLGTLNVADYNNTLDKIMTQQKAPEVRAAMLTALYKLKYAQIETVIKRGMEDKEVSVRTTALGLLDQLDITKENLPGIVNPVFKNATVQEQQELLRVLGKMPVAKTEPVFDNLLDQMKSNRLSSSLTLDLTEAIDSTHSEKLIAKLAPMRKSGTSPDAYQDALNGGNRQRGRNYFLRGAVQCTRCHALGGEGLAVGPDLNTIGDVLTREQLLQALIEPSARLSPGFGVVTLTLKDNQVISGVLIEETKSELTLKTSDAEPLKVPVSRINKRENTPSSMPPMAALMTKREIRDVVEFLANQKKSSFTQR